MSHPPNGRRRSAPQPGAPQPGETEPMGEPAKATAESENFRSESFRSESFWEDKRRLRPSKPDAETTDPTDLPSATPEDIFLTRSEWNDLLDAHQDVLDALRRERAMRQQIAKVTDALGEGLAEQTEQVREEAAHWQRMLRQASAEASAELQVTKQRQARALQAVATSATEQTTQAARRAEQAAQTAASQAEKAEQEVARTLRSARQVHRTINMWYLGGVVLAVVMVTLAGLALLTWQRPGWALTDEQEAKIAWYDKMERAVGQMTEEERRQMSALIEAGLAAKVAAAKGATEAEMPQKK